ncbi:MAG: DUF1501 domain-containing protein [Polyangiaceae bacterium]|jgi:hypothetical protein|nr:DUF1501 domain-containing protein [Polyangiaceae bacterium]
MMPAMQRRRFLQLASLAGLSVVAPVGLNGINRLRAQEQRYDGPMWFFVHAGGGWDPTMLCDPKGIAPINRNYTADQIGRVGNIAYAPIVYNEGAYSNQAFFTKFGSRLCVINGVETMTNNHDTGTVHTWSGRLGDGNPALGALIAGIKAPSKPLGFVSAGGFDKTEGLTSVTRVDNVDVISRIAYPNRNDPTKEEDLFHTSDTAARIAKFQRERLEAASGGQTLPALGAVTGQLFLSRTGSNELDLLMQYAPKQEELRNAPDLLRQAMIAIAGYRAGISVAASLSVGGFDTHGNHDQNQANALARLLTGLDALITYADAQIANNFVIVVGSDFGRTPVYNQQNGKDHWSATSMMMLGKGIRGDRVIGGTDDKQLSVGVDATTFAPLPGDRKASKITPGVVHRSLRQLAGIDQDEKARYYPVSGEELSLSLS